MALTRPCVGLPSARRPESPATVADPERIAARLQQLWQIAHGPAGGADRPAYSDAEAEAMTLVAAWAAQLSLTPAIDAYGNLWALPDGWDGPVLTTGSHVDTVPDGGRYDGALGTVLGLELVAELADGDGGAADTDRARPGLLVCAAEEAPRFGAGTVGSRLLTGALSSDALAELRDADGVSALAARDRYLDALADLPRTLDPPLQRIRAHAEIHVALRLGPPELGIVTHVASPRRLAVTITGDSGHAGEVAMDARRDALCAAAEVVLAVESAAAAEPVATVATVGTLAVEPGAVSVIPGQTRLGIDIRAIDATSLHRLERVIRDRVQRIGARRAVQTATALTRGGEPTALDPALAAQALEAARTRGYPAAETWSGAGHDAQHINGIAPALLMFVPLHGGQSHTPQEGAEMTEILQAVEVAAAVLADAG
jgi:hydantoinase/carbamoylase family amidase